MKLETKSPYLSTEAVQNILNDKTTECLLLMVYKIDEKYPSNAKKNIGTFINTQACIMTRKNLIFLNDNFPQRWGKTYLRMFSIPLTDITEVVDKKIIFSYQGETHEIIFRDKSWKITKREIIPNFKITWDEKYIKHMEETNMNEATKTTATETMEERNMTTETTVATETATADLASSYPEIMQEYADTDSVKPSMVETASQPITNVADFLAMVHSRRESLSDGKIKLSLAEVIERLDGNITIQKIEQCENEGRAFYLVQLNEQTYMTSFKMMTTIIAKWVQACGGVDNLNNMLSQTEIKMKLSKSEYMGKSYTRCDII